MVFRGKEGATEFPVLTPRTMYGCRLKKNPTSEILAVLRKIPAIVSERKRGAEHQTCWNSSNARVDTHSPCSRKAQVRRTALIDNFVSPLALDWGRILANLISVWSLTVITRRTKKMETYLHVAAELHFDSGVEVEWSIMKGLQHGKEIALINVYNAALEDDYEMNDDSIPITCFEYDDGDDETSNESSEKERRTYNDVWDGAVRRSARRSNLEKSLMKEPISSWVSSYNKQLQAAEITTDAANVCCGCSNNQCTDQSVVKEDTNASTDILSNVHPVNEDEKSHPIIDDLFMTDILRAIAIEQDKVASEKKKMKGEIELLLSPRTHTKGCKNKAKDDNDQETKTINEYYVISNCSIYSC